LIFPLPRFDWSAETMQRQGVQQIFEQHRDELLRYLRAHGAGDAAEDLLHELWMKFVASPAGPIAAPRNYLFRAATNLIIDRRRSEVQATRREIEWADAADRLPGSPANDPGAERAMDGRRRLAIVEAELGKLPPRAVAIFRKHRLEGQTQRAVARAMGVSASTVESDLRMVYRLLDELRRKLDEE
jgi:RNA polymerase sigma-70 factor (ECF subfamily)